MDKTKTLDEGLDLFYDIQFPRSSKMSTIWNFFKKSVDNKGSKVAVCSLCSKFFGIPLSKTTTNLHVHMREKHLGEYRSSEKTHEKGQGKKEEGGSTQLSLDESFKRKLTRAQKKAIDRELAQLIAKASLPLSFTSLESLKEFTLALNPGYVPPNIKTLLS
ncbi:BED zinc finger [Ancylostoma caninum]|uniref:BED zinc finger n=1 Tax=Ancylostoma caninum TaxID=29170 RepID=A0A368G9T5_ANCCA|nr:BED zinc finger [Ancylostoma caninum]